MLRVTPQAMTTLERRRTEALHQVIVDHWLASRRTAGAAATPAGRQAVLSQIDEAARSDPSLTQAELVLLADLMLVETANRQRHGRH